MKKNPKETKNLELDRLVFFSDAVVAIAITLLALDLKLNPEVPGHVSFADLANSWKKFSAFLLSFTYVAVFWKIHHQFFAHIRRIDGRLLFYNLVWLLFIVLLPFSASLISQSFTDTPAMFVYCFNTFMITLFQNQIWDHVAARPNLLKEDTDKAQIYDNQLTCNIALINGVLATLVTFISPVFSFIILLSRLPMIWVAKKIWSRGR